MPTQSREIRLASRPRGEPTLDNFSFATVELPDPGPGEVLVSNLVYVSRSLHARANERRKVIRAAV